jgi:hypothetical protein
VRRIVVVLAAAALAVAAAHAFATSARRPPKTFSISGHVVGLYPGSHSRLALRVRNPWSAAIRVTSLSARVGPSGRPCPVQNVRIGRFGGSLLVRARSARTVVVDAGLLASAPTGCAGAAFPLTFVGRAVGR